MPSPDTHRATALGRTLVAIVLVACLAPCTACMQPLLQPVAAPLDRSQYRACGWQWQLLPLQHRSRLHGTVALSGIDRLPGVVLLLENTDAPHLAYLAISDSRGRFDFGAVPPGRYRLNTCLTGFDTIEMPIIVTPYGSSRRMHISLNLSA